MAKYRGQSVLVTDKRVRMMSEILNCIKLIKMYAWESSFAKTIGKHSKLCYSFFYIIIKRKKINF